ncbi:Eukaryotic-type carbonic anhydrase [Phytophthora infestans]|uniref:carbonic anhydrase n=1 Tax=Phytophthora infestans TaxID=4787 RepID=A0A8S9U969_PHYIN|nr:Eukaryotic-type carbonic anhydrase [Phytophthora infestans]
MKFIVTISAIVAACGLAASSVAAAGADGAPWDYNPKDTQRASPAQWGEYYPACNGTNQSPIDIVPTDVEQRSKLRSTLRFRGSCPSFNLTQSGEGYKGAVIDGSCQVKANKAHSTCTLLRNGEPLDGEVHFVHSNADGSALLLIVVGVFMEIDPSGNTDPWLEAVIDGIDDVSSTKPAMLDLTSYSALIKKSVGRGALYNCPGSLTTPGCDEIVDWWVVEKPMRISAKDLTCIRENQGEIEMNYKNENSRPVQALNDRTIQSFK